MKFIVTFLRIRLSLIYPFVFFLNESSSSEHLTFPFLGYRKPKNKFINIHFFDFQPKKRKPFHLNFHLLYASVFLLLTYPAHF